MKKLILVASIALAFASCNTEEPLDSQETAIVAKAPSNERATAAAGTYRNSYDIIEFVVDYSTKKFLGARVSSDDSFWKSIKSGTDMSYKASGSFDKGIAGFWVGYPSINRTMFQYRRAAGSRYIAPLFPANPLLLKASGKVTLSGSYTIKPNQPGTYGLHSIYSYGTDTKYPYGEELAHKTVKHTRIIFNEVIIGKVLQDNPYWKEFVAVRDLKGAHLGNRSKVISCVLASHDIGNVSTWRLHYYVKRSVELVSTSLVPIKD